MQSLNTYPTFRFWILFCFTSVQILYIIRLFLDGNFSDGLMLHQFPEDYKHPNTPFYAIKWAIFDAPGPVSARDVCWLEYGDIRLDEHGKEFGFGVVSMDTIILTMALRWDHRTFCQTTLKKIFQGLDTQNSAGGEMKLFLNNLPLNTQRRDHFLCYF
jgi:hypothetical protein